MTAQLYAVYIFLMKPPYCFLGDHTILHFYQQCMKDSVSPYPCQNMVFSVIFILAILM